jgi:hypothetical protein
MGSTGGGSLTKNLTQWAAIYPMGSLYPLNFEPGHGTSIDTFCRAVASMRSPRLPVTLATGKPRSSSLASGPGSHVHRLVDAIGQFLSQTDAVRAPSLLQSRS